MRGIDQEHLNRLVEVEEPFPPIVVHRVGMQVIDGMHRLLAAVAKGLDVIEVEFFDGSPEDAFLRAVENNVAHGLPLSLADRRAAAARIIASHPQMSDRAVAAASGLGAKSVAAIRRRLPAPGQPLNARVGRDGRMRPVNSTQGRLRAAQVLKEKPDAPVRELARIAGISPTTASDVRRRVRAGEVPVPERQPPTPAQPDPMPPSEGGAPSADEPSSLVLEKLLRDPSLRMREEGRHLLRLLHENEAAEWLDLGAAVPSHCTHLVRDLARHYAANWLEFAQYVEEREGFSPRQSG
ncbi:transcriptional regulator [Streptomyces sp. NPDC008079]|uniref:ParB/RepB/Spo0J family partition protein n=1 Tax=unclassified Streptomyces TaxID=2593676 RepID=UPI0036E374CD